MKKILPMFLVVASLAATAFAGNAQWMTDFEAAREKAKKEDKPILMNFTGSDFCPPCIMLSKEVFQTKEFNEYAEANLVLMEVDFPQAKKQPPSLQRQNEALASALAIPGFPSLYLVTHDLKVITPRLGYYPGGPKVWIDGLKRFIEANK